MKKICFVILISVFLFLTLAVPSFAEELTLFTDKDSIDVDMRFNGSKVLISGQAPENSNIYVKFLSPEKSVSLSKMGKKVVLWMAVENVTVEGIPGMFQILSSGPIDDLNSDLQARMGIDKNYKSVLSKAKVLRHGDNPGELTGDQAENFLNGLININQEKGLYCIDEGGVIKKGNSYEANLNIPADIPRGISTIEVYAVKNGEIIAQTSKTIAASPIGIVQTLSQMARDNAFIYGICAVGIALGTGLLISTVFRKINQIVFKEESDLGAHH